MRFAPCMNNVSNLTCSWSKVEVSTRYQISNIFKNVNGTSLFHQNGRFVRKIRLTLNVIAKQDFIELVCRNAFPLLNTVVLSGCPAWLTSGVLGVFAAANSQIVNLSLCNVGGNIDDTDFATVCTIYI
jgi:hypothetical protein